MESLEGEEAEGEGTRARRRGKAEEEGEEIETKKRPWVPAKKKAPKGGPQLKGPAAPNAEATAKKEVFAEECSVCHGATGHGGNGGPDLRTMPLAKNHRPGPNNR